MLDLIIMIFTASAFSFSTDKIAFYSINSLFMCSLIFYGVSYVLFFILYPKPLAWGCARIYLLEKMSMCTTNENQLPNNNRKNYAYIHILEIRLVCWRVTYFG